MSDQKPRPTSGSITKNELNDELADRFERTREQLKTLAQSWPTQENLDSLNVTTRLKLLDDLVASGSSRLPSSYVRDLFPEISELEIFETKPRSPSTAPALWKVDRRREETPPQFIFRNYWEFLGRGLTRAHIRSLDPPLYEALASWLKFNEMPPEIDLPTLEEQNDRWVARFQRTGTYRSLQAMGIHSPEDLRRLAGLMAKRISGKRG